MSYQPGEGWRIVTPDGRHRRWSCYLCEKPPVGRRRNNLLVCADHMRKADIGNRVVVAVGAAVVALGLAVAAAAALDVFTAGEGYISVMAAGGGAYVAVAAWKDLP